MRGLPKFKFKSQGVSKFSRALEDIFPREIQTLGVAGTIMDTMIARSINPDAKCKFFSQQFQPWPCHRGGFPVGGECENLLGDFLSGGKNFKNSDFEHLDPF